MLTKPNNNNNNKNPGRNQVIDGIWPGALLCMLIFPFTDLLFLFDRLLTHFWHKYINTCPFECVDKTMILKAPSKCVVLQSFCKLKFYPFTRANEKDAFIFHAIKVWKRRFTLITRHGVQKPENYLESKAKEKTCCLLLPAHINIYTEPTMALAKQHTIHILLETNNPCT